LLKFWEFFVSQAISGVFACQTTVLSPECKKFPPFLKHLDARSREILPFSNFNKISWNYVAIAIITIHPYNKITIRATNQASPRWSISVNLCTRSTTTGDITVNPSMKLYYRFLYKPDEMLYDGSEIEGMAQCERRNS